MEKEEKAKLLPALTRCDESRALYIRIVSQPKWIAEDAAAAMAVYQRELQALAEAVREVTK